MAFYGCLCRSCANLGSSINIKCLLGALWLYGFYVVLHSFPQLEQVLLMQVQSNDVLMMVPPSVLFTSCSMVNKPVHRCHGATQETISSELINKIATDCHIFGCAKQRIMIRKFPASCIFTYDTLNLSKGVNSHVGGLGAHIEGRKKEASLLYRT